MTETRLILRLALSIPLVVSARIAGAPQWQSQTSGATASLRGVSAVNDRVAWASGTKGTFLRTVDGGKTWQAGTVAGAEELDFRDVQAFDARTAYLLSIGNGELSRIYKTTDGGEHWTMQFKNTQPDGFLDAMAFWDARHGIAMSDPVNGRFMLFTTDNGGAAWNPVPSEGIPPALPGEAAFAASGTCIAVEGKNNVWFATGGGAARVFRSADRGRSWSVAATPILSGIESAGIFSIAFRDANHGIVVGGDYRKPNDADRNAAITTDGGRTWQLLEGSKPAGFRSCVAWTRSRQGLALIAVGTSGSEYSLNHGRDWIKLDQENYNSASFAAAGVGWAVGPNGRVAKFKWEQ